MSNDLDIRLFNLSNYVRPEVVEQTYKGWVLNGKNNSFYQTIIDRVNGSPTNSAIINSYVDLIYGKGLGANNSTTNIEDWVKLKKVLKPKDLKRIVADFEWFGEASFQIIETKGGKLSSIEHLPKQKVVPSLANEDNEIESYWISNNWKNLTQNPAEEFSAFNTSKDAIEIFVIKPYKAGKDYFSDPDWLSGMPYAEMEEEIANVNINSIKNGLSAGYIINVPDGKSLSDEEKAEFERKIKLRLTGSPNATTFVLSFNGRDVEVTITPFPVNDNIHKQWQFLVTEAKQQLLTAHRVTSPMIFGIKDNTGLGNNANELKESFKLLYETVIPPKQAFILDALSEVLEFYGINLDLFFIPLADISEEVEPTQMSAHTIEATEDMANELIQFGDSMDEKEWILLSTADVDYDTDDDLYDLIQLTDTGVARPNAKSSQDSVNIAIRYRYVGNPLPERLFCQKMMLANKLYRKEDILQMGNKGSNNGFGAGGSDNYSIWLWKGGGKRSTAFPNGTCKHKWQREIYLKRDGDVDVNSPLAKTISTSEARRRGYKVPVNDSDVSIAPHKNKS